MKQCPVCNETFEDPKAFCDMDGSALVDETDSLPATLSQATPSSSGITSAWVTGVIGGVIGVILCVLLYLLFLAPGRQTALDQQQSTTEASESKTVKPGQVALAPTNNQAPAPTPSPAETESPAEEAPSPSPAAPVATPPPAALNHGPIATGTKEVADGDRAIIKLKDGSTVEADAAWEDAQGVWFRRRGLVSFVDKSKVEAITQPQKKPAATESKTP